MLLKKCTDCDEVGDLAISGKFQGWSLTESQKYMDIHMICTIKKLFLCN